MKKHKGFTLIELIVALSIAVTLVGIAYTMYFSGVQSFDMSYEGYQNQADIRNAIEITNESIRFSTVGFAISAEDYRPVIEKSADGGNDTVTSGLLEPWNYIGLSPDKARLCRYVYVQPNSGKGHYTVETLIEAKEGITYRLNLEKAASADSEKMIHYILSVVKNGKVQTEITTEIEAINALQVIDWGDSKNPAIALAYRTEDTPNVNDQPTTAAAVAVVLDTSGSMDWGLDGEGTGVNNYNPQRLALLKNTLTDPDVGIFKILEDTEAFVSLVPFSANANMPHTNYGSLKNVDKSKFYKVSNTNDKKTLNKMVNALVANGSTNTGDGMRRAYSQLLEFEARRDSYGVPKDQAIKKYMIILVDGVTTVASAEVDYEELYYNHHYSEYNAAFNEFVLTPSGDIENYFFTSNPSILGSATGKLVASVKKTGEVSASIGDGANLDKDYGEVYVQKIGQMIETSNIVDQCFVIGYSNYTKNGVYTELESVANIASSLGITVGSNEASEKFVNNKYVFIATDGASLEDSFNTIGGFISDGLWQIEGPKLDK